MAEQRRYVRWSHMLVHQDNSLYLFHTTEYTDFYRSSRIHISINHANKQFLEQVTNFKFDKGFSILLNDIVAATVMQYYFRCESRW